MPRWWGWIAPVIAVLAVVSLIPLAMLYYARSSLTPAHRTSIIPDMDNQPKYRAQAANPLFTDQRAMRPPVAGTVARGMLADDSHLNLGVVGEHWATDFPAELEIDAPFLLRGQERYNVFCAPCHGLDGYGNGMISQRAGQLAERAWIAPLSYHTPTVRERPVGHLYNTISNGIRTMPAYSTQVPVKDRWAIVAYLRALQLSQYAGLEDIPAEQREALRLQAEEQQTGDGEDQSRAAEGEDPITEEEAEPDEAGGEQDG
jgi:mono/diheme cytochrome c family protein